MPRRGQEWKEGWGGGSKLLRGGMVGRRMSEGQREGGEEVGWRSDGVINDRVFNTLYGLAYKLRPVHRSSWQRINGLEEQTTGMISLSLSLSLSPSFPANGVSDLSPRQLLFCGFSSLPFLPSPPFLLAFSFVALSSPTNRLIIIHPD